MTAATINTITINSANKQSITNWRQAIRNAFTTIGFPATDYDFYTSGGVFFWVMEYVWDNTKPNGKIFVRLSMAPSGNNWRIMVDTFRTWNTVNRTGTSASRAINIGNGIAENPALNIDATNINDLVLTGISHPEILGFIVQQNTNVGYFYLTLPANKEVAFGFDDIIHPWFFITGNFDKMYYCTSVGGNPFADAGEYGIETWATLKNRFQKVDKSEIFQLAPAPRIISPTRQGFMGRFSNDICLVNSNLLPVGSRFSVGLDEYFLFCAKSSSGFAIKLN